MARLVWVLCIISLLEGCQEQKASTDEKLNAKKLNFLDSIKNRLPEHFSMEQLKTYIHEGDLKAASRYVNIALKGSVNNPALHVINGYIYEEITARGDNSYADFAGVAYRSAHSLDPTHWLYVYLLGDFELKGKNYELAQEHLADALVLYPDNPEILYSLACASYYLKDLPVALFAINKALSLKPNEPNIQRSAAHIFAAAAQFKKAKCALANYKKLDGSNPQDIARVEQRLMDWQASHNQIKCAGNEIVSGKVSNSAVKNSNLKTSKEDNGPPTIILDCCLLDVLEDNLTSKGNNLLRPSSGPNSLGPPLSIALGGAVASGSSAQNPFASFTRNVQNNAVGFTGPKTSTVTWGKNYSFGITPQALTYALNIANATIKTVELIGRPTLSTLLNKPAVFSNADRYSGTAAGTTGGATINVDVGIKVEVTPLALKDDLVTLEISLTGTALAGEHAPIIQKSIQDQLISVTKAKTSTTINVKIGQTAMVASLYAVANTSTSTRVPLLGDLPILQYFFSNLFTTQDKRSVLYLVTPRLGGNCAKKDKQLSCARQTNVSKKLYAHGMSPLFQEDYQSLHFILKHLDTSSMFVDFQSGDVIPTFWGHSNSSLSSKLEGLAKFLYF